MYGNSRSLMLEYNSHGDVWIQFKRFIGTHKLTSWDPDHTDERSSELRSLQQENKIRTEVKGLSGVYLHQKSLQNPATSFWRSLFSVVEPVLEPRLTSDSEPWSDPCPPERPVLSLGSLMALLTVWPEAVPPHSERNPCRDLRLRMVTVRAARGAAVVLYHGADLEI